MLNLNLRRNADHAMVPVDLSCLSMEISGDFRFPAEELTSNGNRIDAEYHGPAVIVRCADKQDALRCLEFASRHGLLIAMHNGPDDPTTWRDCGQGIAVDLRGLVRAAA